MNVHEKRPWAYSWDSKKGLEVEKCISPPTWNGQKRKELLWNEKQ